jgi:hypothetical protein
MLTLKECMDFSGLREAEIEAIAEHERIPELEAMELGSLLLSTTKGRRQIRRMIADDLHQACRSGDVRHAAEVRRTLSNYVEAHPDCRESRSKR